MLAEYESTVCLVFFWFFPLLVLVAHTHLKKSTSALILELIYTFLFLIFWWLLLSSGVVILYFSKRNNSKKYDLQIDFLIFLNYKLGLSRDGVVIVILLLSVVNCWAFLLRASLFLIIRYSSSVQLTDYHRNTWIRDISSSM